MHFSYFQQQFWMHFYKLPKQQIHKLQTHTHAYTQTHRCMHMYAQKWYGKSAHKLLLYFVAIFILPTLVRKLRDETMQQRRKKLLSAGCRAGWLPVWICIYVANNGNRTRAPPHHACLPGPCHVQLRWHGHKHEHGHWASGGSDGDGSVNSRLQHGVYAIFTRDTQQMAALGECAIFQALKQATKEKRKQKQNKTKKNQQKSVQKNRIN